MVGKPEIKPRPKSTPVLPTSDGAASFMQLPDPGFILVCKQLYDTQLGRLLCRQTRGVTRCTVQGVLDLAQSPVVVVPQ